MDRKNTFIRLIWAVLCLIALCVPLLTMPFSTSSVERENRGEAGAPRITDEHFAQSFDDWFGDHFGLRNELITLNSLVNVRLLKTSPNKDVIVGKNGELFFGETVNDYTGGAPLKWDEEDAVSWNISRIMDSVASRGGKVYIAVVPNKNSVYTDAMPSLYPKSAKTGNADMVYELAAKAGAVCVDIKTALCRAAEAGRVYYKTDTHWNEQGAYVAANEILKAMGKPAPPAVTDIGFMQYDSGDLAVMLSLEGRLDDPSPELSFERDLPRGDYSEHYAEADGSGEGELLVLRDSFGTAIAPFLADAYAHTVFRWETPLYACSRGDVLILIAERNIREYLLETPQVFAPKREAVSGAAADCDIEIYADEDGVWVEPIIGSDALYGSSGLWQGVSSGVFVRAGDNWYNAAYSQGSWEAYLPFDEISPDTLIQAAWTTSDGLTFVSDEVYARDLGEWEDADYGV